MIGQDNNQQSYRKPADKSVEAAAASVGLGKAEEESDGAKYPGTERLTYLIITAILVVVGYICIKEVAGVSLTAALEARMMPEQAVKTLTQCGAWVLFVTFVGLSISRLENVGFHWYVVLALFVPLANLWALWTVVACPPGFLIEKKLGLAGVLLTIVLVLLLISSGLGTWWLLTQQVAS